MFRPFKMLRWVENFIQSLEQQEYDYDTETIKRLEW